MSECGVIMQLKLTLLFISSLSSAFAASACLVGPEWNLKSTVQGHFAKGMKNAQTANLYVLKVDDAPMSEQEYRALITIEGDNKCLLKREGKNASEGEPKMPTANSAVFALPLTPDRDAVRLIDTYAHGFTQETTYLMALESVGGGLFDLKEVWSGSTYQVDPTGAENLAPMALQLDAVKKVAVVTHKRKGKILKWIWNPDKAAFSELPVK